MESKKNKSSTKKILWPKYLRLATLCFLSDFHILLRFFSLIISHPVEKLKCLKDRNVSLRFFKENEQFQSISLLSNMRTNLAFVLGFSLKHFRNRGFQSLPKKTFSYFALFWSSQEKNTLNNNKLFSQTHSWALLIAIININL